MGCTSSKPDVHDDKASDKTSDCAVAPTAEVHDSGPTGTPKSSTTRARRLSWSADAKGQRMLQVPVVDMEAVVPVPPACSLTGLDAEPDIVPLKAPLAEPAIVPVQATRPVAAAPEPAGASVPAASPAAASAPAAAPPAAAEVSAAERPAGAGAPPAECEVARHAENSSTPVASDSSHLPVTCAQALERNSSTRARRLSYITNDKDLADKIRAEYGELYTEEETGSSAGGALAVPPRRGVNILVACMSRAGREPGYKKTNQDSCFAFEKYISEDGSLFGAMDGHGPHGHLVSSFVKQHLPILLVDHLTSGCHPQAALSHGFLEVDARLGASFIDCEFSGSTCVVAYLKGNQLTTAWVGDSRCVMGRRTQANGWEAIDLTADHKPTNPGEIERIMRSQGRVERLLDEMGQPMGPHRVWLQHAWVPGLAMSRALGDQLAHQVGVSSAPDHHHLSLSPCDKFMVLASDGVWEFITSQEAVELVAACNSIEDACRALVDEAYQRWLVEEDGVVDDITVVVVRFLHDGEDDRLFMHMTPSRPKAARAAVMGAAPDAAAAPVAAAVPDAGTAPASAPVAATALAPFAAAAPDSAAAPVAAAAPGAETEPETAADAASAAEPEIAADEASAAEMAPNAAAVAAAAAAPAAGVPAGAGVAPPAAIAPLLPVAAAPPGAAVAAT